MHLRGRENSCKLLIDAMETERSKCCREPNRERMATERPGPLLPCVIQIVLLDS